MNKKQNLKKILSIIIAIILLISGDCYIRYKNSLTKTSGIISSSLENIRHNHEKITREWNELDFENLSSWENNFPFNEKERKDQSIYIFQNDSLIFWNSNINDPQTLLKNIDSTKNIFHYGNRYFYITLSKKDNYKLFTSTLLYRDNPYKINNDHFIPAKINGSYKMTFFIGNNGNIDYEIEYQPKMNDIDSFVLAIILIFILFISYNYLFSIIQHCNLCKVKYLVFFVLSLFIYFLFRWLREPLFLSTSQLFGVSCISPDSNYSISLGRLAEFSIFFMVNVFVLTQNYLKKKINIKTSLRIILSTFIFIFIFFTYVYLIFSLISNTNISLSFLQIYDTTAFSYILLIIICVITSFVIILLHNLVNFFINENQSYLLSLFVFVIFSFIYEFVLNHLIDFRFSLITNIIGLLFYFIILWERKSKIKKKTIITNALIISLITTQLTYILYFINETNEKEEMKWFAMVVGDESDKSFENAMISIIDEIKVDNNIINWQKTNTFPEDDSILNYLEAKYFNREEINDYNKVLTLCDTCTILVIPDLKDLETPCDSFFNRIVQQNHIEEITDELFLVDDPTIDSYYLMKLDLSNIDNEFHNTFYIEFYKEYIINSIGVPEFLTSYQNVLLPNLVNYSFSCYENDILYYKYGPYIYPDELHNFRFKDKDYVKTKNFKHLISRINDHKIIIVTVEKPRLIEIIAPFSYIFLILLLIFHINMRVEKGKNVKNKRFSFHSRIRFTILMTLGFSFLVAGFTSFIFIRNSLNKKTSEYQYDRTKTIVKGLEEAIANNINIKDPNILKNYKEIFFTDINIYDFKGNLINTTQPKLFEKFKSKIINKEAYNAISIKNHFYYSHQEYLDNTAYFSVYISALDKNGNRYAIINIPYFENNMTSQSSMSNFIITYLNIILIFMGLSGIIVILVTRNTIKPLSMIQDKMTKISLGGKNEAIDWESDDEIGDLIKIYNKLIKELEISANQLVRSERETAWREVARQVAHEIKNPLTPMKLNIQFLQMAWNEHDPDIDKKLKETINSTLEQIETLSRIATAFSDYAKLPKNNIEYFNIKDLLINTINIYDNEPNITFDLIEENESDFIIKSDKNNLSIVFGNIIKNAIQAIGKKNDGNIKISINDSGDKYIINISDNGCGIRPEEQKKIFLPNFTTKSSGMGVGLSIVYHILESLESNISFVSEVGKGTVFKIELKK